MSEHDPEITTATSGTGETSVRLPFSGSPARYRRIALWGSLGLHLYLFVGYWAIRTFLVGEAWPASWVTPALTVASSLWFAHFAYRYIMRLDAQYGSGGGWVLHSTRVKLPWEAGHER